MNASLPRLLLVEDDPVSAAFLREALASLPAIVEHAETLVAATSLAERATHALYLVDANLPDGIGEDWLPACRARGWPVPALALTAEVDTRRLDALIAAGFQEVLQKPLSVSALHAGVRRGLGEATHAMRTAPTGKLPVWDEARALAALGGDAVALSKLRALFLQELPQQRDAVLEALARNAPESARGVLHMLKASTAFVGAARLAQASQRLSQAPDDADARDRFLEAVSDQLAE